MPPHAHADKTRPRLRIYKFFQGVACQLITTELEGYGFASEYITCAIDCEEDKEQWGGITFRYSDEQ